MARVQVVDDEAAVCSLLRAALEKDGHEIRIFQDPLQALDDLQTNECDILIADIIMPQMSGLELLQAVKAINRDIKVILITGGPRLESAIEATRIGAYDYLTKPIEPKRIRKVVNSASLLKQLEDENRKYHNELEKLVKKRTAALEEKNKQLRDVAKRLDEANIALKVLLEHKDKEKVDQEEKVLTNIKTLVMPYLQKLGDTRLTNQQRDYISILETNLKETISPFLSNIKDSFLGLTPREIEVANFIKNGKTSKEIAEIMIVSTETVNHHRQSIRKKLGLANTKTNLRNQLLTLSK